MENSLTIDLFEPGMGPLHRAGLGGLAATIRRLKLSSEEGFDFDERRLKLTWRSEDCAGFFRRLYENAFDLREGLIHLPGSYDSVEPTPEVKAELQQGMALTILQFGPNRKAGGPARERTFEVDGQPVVVTHQNLIGYTHRAAWKDLLTTKGKLKPLVEISGTIAPGFVQRHVAHAATKIEQRPGLAIALHFALVGTLAMRIGLKSAVLLVPDVDDLVAFARRRGALTPRTPRQCHVANPADAALQAHLRLLKASAGDTLGLGRCLAVRFAAQSWNEKQKTRAEVLDTEPEVLDVGVNRRSLIRFEVAMLELAPRVFRPRYQSEGQPREPSYWVPSLVRPLVAENLAMGRPWFQDFRKLVVAGDGSNDEQRLRQLAFERKGLQAMIDLPSDDKREELLIVAIHQAMWQRFGKLWDDSQRNPTTFRNRKDRQMQEWRLAFAHAKTADGFRDALADLLSRAGQVPALMESWREIRPLFSDSDRWRLNRDLALLALASYRGSGKEDDDAPVPAPENLDDSE